MDADEGYQAGVCNIGREEITVRRRFGQVALLVTLVSTVLMFWLKAAPSWRWLLFLPAMSSASGFLQAKNRFCSGFGSKGIYNFGERGKTEAVADDESRRKDREKSRQITVKSVLIAAAFAAAMFAVSFF